MKTAVIDTNILIYREDYKIVSEDIQTLSQILNSDKIRAFIHPASLKDIEQDKDPIRKKSMLSKINCYPKLDSPPSFLKNEIFKKKINFDEKSSVHNDQIDNELLYAISVDCAEYLISEDKGIHTKARLLGISDKVLTVAEAIQKFKEDFPKEKIVGTPPAIKLETLNSEYLNQEFFNSLREEYGKDNFESWFKRKCIAREKAYIHKDNEGKIDAFLMLKKEGKEDKLSSPDMPNKNRIKICTLKVINNGKKIGELFIKLSIKKAIQEGIEEIYVTHFAGENDPLVKLLLEFGFYESKYKIKHENNQKLESIFIKNILTPPGNNLNPLEVDYRYFPSFYDGEKVNKFIVPIMPEYHQRLFTDYSRQTTLDEHSGEFIIEGNTIKKAYLCRANTREICPGDILLFYKTHGDMKITSIGVVEKVLFNPTHKEIMEATIKRTVYNEKEIHSLNPSLVLLFKHNFHLPNKINLSTLHKNGIITGNIYQIRKINHQSYLKIKRLSKLKPEFTVW